jgi:hypothetical protein
MAPGASVVCNGWNHVFGERTTRRGGFAVVSHIDRVRRSQSVGLCNDASVSGINGVEAVW